MQEKTIMRRLRNLQEPVLVDVEPATLLANPKQGLEKHVNRAELFYPKFGKTVNGLVLITPTSHDYLTQDYAEQYVQTTVEQWKRLKEINQRRSRDGQTMLLLPPTVRHYKDEDFVGLLMTDLSENNTQPITDVRELNPGDVTREQWENISSL